MGNKSTNDVSTKASDVNASDTKFLHTAKEERMAEQLLETHTRLPRVLCKIIVAYFIPRGRRILIMFEKYKGESDIICQLDLDECRRSRLLGDDVFKPISPLVYDGVYDEYYGDYSDCVLSSKNSGCVLSPEDDNNQNNWAYNFKTGKRYKLMTLSRSTLEEEYESKQEGCKNKQCDLQYSMHFILGRRHYFLCDNFTMANSDGFPLVFVEELKFQSVKLKNDLRRMIKCKNSKSVVANRETMWNVPRLQRISVVCRNTFYMFIYGFQSVYTFKLLVDPNDETRIDWIKLEECRLSLHSCRVVADDVNGRIYFINLNHYKNDESYCCKYFDVITRHWVKIAPLPEECLYIYFAVASEGCVILFEKFLLSKFENDMALKFMALDVYCYNPVADSWFFMTRIELRNLADIEFYPITCI